MFLYPFIFIFFLPPAEQQGNRTNPSRPSYVISCRRRCSSNIRQNKIQAVYVSANHRNNRGRHLYQTWCVTHELTVTSGGGGEGRPTSGVLLTLTEWLLCRALTQCCDCSLNISVVLQKLSLVLFWWWGSIEKPSDAQSSFTTSLRQSVIS